MAAMTSTAINRASAEEQIWKACNVLRDVLPVDQGLDVVLDVLLWARWIPSSDGDLIGYFDSMRSLASTDDWNSIQVAISKCSGTTLFPAVGIRRLEPKWIERIRAALLPVGRALNSGDLLQCKAVIEAMGSLKSDNRRGAGWGSSSSIESLWESLLAFHLRQEVACLFPIGIAAAPRLGMDHPLLISSADLGLETWTFGLLSLYAEAVKPKSVADYEAWPLAIAAPPWCEKSRGLLVDDPWLPPSPLDCPAAIKDTEARRVYGAHQRCTGTTYALVSAGLGFRTSKDLEYFREELVRKNWLDAAVALPPVALASSNAKGLLLVLRKDRPAGAPVLLVSAEELLMPSSGRGSKQSWKFEAVKQLADLLHERRETSDSRLVVAEELEANGFSFQVSRYLRSEVDQRLHSYLDSRTTMQLGDLAEIKRPVASLGRHEDDGIEVREVTPGDIDNSGQLLQGSKLIRLPEAALAKVRQQLLEPGDVLLSIKGGLGKVAVVQDLDHPTVPGQAFCVVRLRPNAPLTPAALVQYLRSSLGQTLLNKIGQGTTVAFMPMAEVKGLPVVIPYPSELQRASGLEQKIVSLSQEVDELNRLLQRLARQGWLEDLPQEIVESDKEGPV